MKTRLFYVAAALLVPAFQAQADSTCGLACQDGIVVPVPEPATIGLIAAGVGALAVMRARRGRK